MHVFSWESVQILWPDLQLHVSDIRLGNGLDNLHGCSTLPFGENRLATSLLLFFLLCWSIMTNAFFDKIDADESADPAESHFLFALASKGEKRKRTEENEDENPNKKK